VNWALLKNSLMVSGLTALLSVSAGFLAALWVFGLERHWRNRVLALAILALVLPPFLVTNCWLDLFGLNGTLRRWLPLNIYSLGGTVWILTLITWPISLVTSLAAWHRLEAGQLESDPLLRGGYLIRWLLWPMSRHLVGLAAVLTFVLALNNFAVPTILQVNVFPAEVWLRYSTQLDLPGALAVSWPLILAPLMLIFLLRRADILWPNQDAPVLARAFRRQVGPRWTYTSAIITLLLLALSVGLPLLELWAGKSTWSELPKVLQAIPGTLWNSLWYAALASLAASVVALATWRLPLGGWLWLPLLVPGVLLGIGLIVIFDRPQIDLFYRSAGIVVLAWTVRYLPIAWHATARAMHAVDPDVTAAARLDGASGWSLLTHIHAPQVAPQIGAAWYLTYLLCLWDVETLVLIMPPGGETIALRIFNLLHYGHNAQVNALCISLLVLAIAPIILLGIIRTIKKLMVHGDD
jgi:iron(III) transport system permease protein